MLTVGRLPAGRFNRPSGCTATVAAVSPTHIAIANLGDARVVLARPPPPRTPSRLASALLEGL